MKNYLRLHFLRYVWLPKHHNLIAGHAGTMIKAPLHTHEAAAFYTTRWTRVCAAKADSDDGRRALADLCDAYYEPVVAYLFRISRDADTARELSHAFFAEMLGGGTIHTADRERGRFRSYLLGAVKHFAARQRESAQRMKRGGGVVAVPLDDPEAGEVADLRMLSPDAEFDRQWAITMLARALDALHRQCVVEGNEAFFHRVKSLLSGGAERGDLVALAAESGMSADAFRMAVHRMKKRLRQCVKAEVAGTLHDPACVEEEMRSLFAALAG